jgi:hypothetical protein
MAAFSADWLNALNFQAAPRGSGTSNLMCVFLSSFLGSTAQLRPWPPPQNLAEFLGGFSKFSLLQGKVVSPTPNPHHGGPGLCIYIPQRKGGYPF